MDFPQTTSKKIMLFFLITLASCSTPDKRGDGKYPELKSFKNRGTLVISNFEDRRGMDELTPRMSVVKPILILNSNNHDVPVYLKNRMIKELERTDLFSDDSAAGNNKNQYQLEGYIASMKVTRMWSWGYCLSPCTLTIPVFDFPEFKASVVYHVYLKKAGKIIFEKDIAVEKKQKKWLFSVITPSSSIKMADLILDRAVDKSIELLLNEINDHL